MKTPLPRTLWAVIHGGRIEYVGEEGRAKSACDCWSGSVAVEVDVRMKMGAKVWKPARKRTVPGGRAPKTLRSRS